MKIVQILGGIGNQMFQYAFLVALRETFNQDVLMDTNLFKSYPLHNGFELDKVFNITAREASSSEIGKVYHKFFLSSFKMWHVYRHLPIKPKGMIEEALNRHYMPELLTDESDRYYIGYWQDRRYFDGYRDIVKKEFTFRKKLDERNQKIFDHLLNTNSVSIHVRRGDYLTDPIYKGICQLDYYKTCIDYLHKTVNERFLFVVFSNDSAWCNENITSLFNKNDEFIIVDWNKGADSYKDMQLMNACKTNIVANSSFSYWGAYLNVNPNPRVFAPKVWANGQVAERQLPEWILV